MKVIMYNQSSVLIALVLLGCMVIAIELGYRLGLKAQNSASESYRQHIDAVQTSLLGILALLIAFTFSIALQRFDSRSEAVVDEANAIGTAYLRTQLLPTSVRGEAQQSLRYYLSLRVKASTIPLDNQIARDAILLKANQTLNTLWHYAIQAAKEDARPVMSGLFIQSLNELIDSFGRRTATIDRHVPEAVLFLLCTAFVVTGSVIGFSVGITSHRPSFVSYIMVGLIVLLVFIIIDLDHPRRGLIQVSQKRLIELQSSVNAEQKSDRLK